MNDRRVRRTATRTARIITAALFCLAAAGTAMHSSDLSQKEGSFEASWTLSGTVTILEYVDGGSVAAGRLQGRVVLKTSQGNFPNFETDCVVFADDRQGGKGRCLWEDPTGDRIYVGTESVNSGVFGQANGRFVGGTGRYRGITGRFGFEWNYSVSGWDDARLDGYTLEMRGNYRVD
jgi:hypothetical protein